MPMYLPITLKKIIGYSLDVQPPVFKTIASQNEGLQCSRVYKTSHK
jgi:hypothetical protein